MFILFNKNFRAANIIALNVYNLYHPYKPSNASIILFTVTKNKKVLMHCFKHKPRDEILAVTEALQGHPNFRGIINYMHHFN